MVKKGERLKRKAKRENCLILTNVPMGRPEYLNKAAQADNGDTGIGTLQL